MSSLFSEQPRISLPDCDIQYFPNFWTTEEATYYYKKFLNTIPWRQDNIRVFGKTYPQPRLTALYGNNQKTYSYANITMDPYPFTPDLLAIKQKITSICTTEFTSCLLNLYRDGKDSNGWHADNEPELGKNPVIASVTFGQERFFHLKHRHIKTARHTILLEHGSLLIMQGTTQEYWLHQIPKSTKAMNPRINLTFRHIH